MEKTHAHPQHSATSTARQSRDDAQQESRLDRSASPNSKVRLAGETFFFSHAVFKASVPSYMERCFSSLLSVPCSVSLATSPQLSRPAIQNFIATTEKRRV